MGPSGFGIDPQACSVVAREVKLALDAGHQIALVIGGGNIFRGVAPAAAGMDRAQADYIGMLGTMMNGLALADVFKHAGMDAGDVYHALRCLELPPEQRLSRGLTRVRHRPHLG